MKTFTALILITVISICNIEVGAFSFNFSGGFNPGISFGRPYSLQQKYQLRSHKSDGDSDWPQPEHVKNYDVSELFSKPIVNSTRSDNNEFQRPQTHHFGSHHRNHRH